MTVKGNFVVNPAVSVPAEAITTDRGIVLIEHEAAVTALCLIQSDSIHES
jgi:hypothetical protein